MCDFLSTVGSQNRRAINDTNSDQIQPQTKATLKSGQGHLPEKSPLEERKTDLKKHWTVGLGATPEMSFTGFLTKMKT